MSEALAAIAIILAIASIVVRRFESDEELDEIEEIREKLTTREER